VPEQPVAVPTDDKLGALLDACASKRFAARRDTAIMHTLLDTGGRLSEVAGLRVDDVDFDLDVLHVMGKGRRVGNRSLFPLAAASGIMAVVVPCHSASARASPCNR
jgi:site-specific recombinase XerC